MKFIIFLVGLFLASVSFVGANANAATTCVVRKSLYDPSVRPIQNPVRDSQIQKFELSDNATVPYLLPYTDTKGTEWNQVSIATHADSENYYVEAHNLNAAGAVDHSIYMDFKKDVKHVTSFSMRSTKENGLNMMFALNCQSEN